MFCRLVESGRRKVWWLVAFLLLLPSSSQADGRYRYFYLHGVVAALDTQTGRLVHPLSGTPADASLLPGGNCQALQGRDGRLELWDQTRLDRHRVIHLPTPDSIVVGSGVVSLAPALALWKLTGESVPLRVDPQALATPPGVLEDLNSNAVTLPSTVDVHRGSFEYRMVGQRASNAYFLATRLLSNGGPGLQDYGLYSVLLRLEIPSGRVFKVASPFNTKRLQYDAVLACIDAEQDGRTVLFLTDSEALTLDLESLTWHRWPWNVDFSTSNQTYLHGNTRGLGWVRGWFHFAVEDIAFDQPTAIRFYRWKAGQEAQRADSPPYKTPPWLMGIDTNQEPYLMFSDRIDTLDPHGGRLATVRFPHDFGDAAPLVVEVGPERVWMVDVRDIKRPRVLSYDPVPRRLRTW